MLYNSHQPTSSSSNATAGNNLGNLTQDQLIHMMANKREKYNNTTMVSSAATRQLEEFNQQ